MIINQLRLNAFVTFDSTLFQVNNQLLQTSDAAGIGANKKRSPEVDQVTFLSALPDLWVSTCMKNRRDNYDFLAFINPIMYHKREIS